MSLPIGVPKHPGPHSATARLGALPWGYVDHGLTTALSSCSSEPMRPCALIGYLTMLNHARTTWTTGYLGRCHSHAILWMTGVHALAPKHVDLLETSPMVSSRIQKIGTLGARQMLDQVRTVIALIGRSKIASLHHQCIHRRASKA